MKKRVLIADHQSAGKAALGDQQLGRIRCGTSHADRRQDSGGPAYNRRAQLGHEEPFRSTALNQPRTGSVWCLLPAALVLHCQDHLDRVAAPDRRGERDTPVVEALPLTGRQGPSRSICAHNQQCHRVQGRNQARCERCPHRLMPAVAGREGRRRDNQGERLQPSSRSERTLQGRPHHKDRAPACPGRRSAWGARNPVREGAAPFPQWLDQAGVEKQRVSSRHRGLE